MQPAYEQLEQQLAAVIAGNGQMLRLMSVERDQYGYWTYPEYDVFCRERPGPKDNESNFI